VFAGNGFRCPITEFGERYGAQSGSAADIYLPEWFAHSMPAIHPAAGPHDLSARTEPAAVAAGPKKGSAGRRRQRLSQGACGDEEETMSVTLRRLPALAGLAVLAGTCVELAGHRAFTRLVQRDVQALHARASPSRAGVVTEKMLADLPEPVRRYLRYAGVVGKPFPGTVRLRQKGRMRLAPGQPWIPLDAQEHYSVQPPGFVWAGTVRLGPLPVARARDMYADGGGGCWSRSPRYGRWSMPAARRWTRAR
jgi:uncharacterized protein DUF6544